MDLLIAAAPYVVAIISIIGICITASRAKSTQLDAAYFDKMSAAYEELMKAFTAFAYAPNDATRDRLSIAVYIAELYASDYNTDGILAAYVEAIKYSRTGQQDIKKLDAFLGFLDEDLRNDLKCFRSRSKLHAKKKTPSENGQK